MDLDGIPCRVNAWEIVLGAHLSAKVAYQHRLGQGHVFLVFDNGIAYRESVTIAFQR
jgi:hypothetical protein